MQRFESASIAAERFARFLRYGASSNQRRRVLGTHQSVAFRSMFDVAVTDLLGPFERSYPRIRWKSTACF